MRIRGSRRWRCSVQDAPEGLTKVTVGLIEIEDPVDEKDLRRLPDDAPANEQETLKSAFA